MDKIRQEFEAWIVSALGCDVADISKDESGVYNSFQTGNLYVAWRASRAALCVELPESECGGDGYYYEDGIAIGHNDCLGLVQSVLDDSGVSYK